MNIETGRSYCFVPYRGHRYKRQLLKCVVVRVMSFCVEVRDENGESWVLPEDELMPINRPY